jgi:superfamily II DNA/RNA helicase
MMFSATLAPRIQQLATRVMRQPQRVQIDNPAGKTPEHQAGAVLGRQRPAQAQAARPLAARHQHQPGDRFASTQIECDGLANDLQQDGFSAVALHGALNQGLRNRRLMALREGHVQILVATDVAARGIDVPTITHVFNFGLPMKAEDYTHRIGRTGRAGRDGLAVTLAEFRDRRKIFDIEAYTRQQFKAEVLPGLEPQQRFPDSRPGGNFGGRNTRGGFEAPSRDRKFGPARGREGAPAAAAPREGFSYKREGGFNDRFAARREPRQDGFAPRPEFVPRKPGADRPDFAQARKPHAVSTPHDPFKRPLKLGKPTRA